MAPRKKTVEKVVLVSDEEIAKEIVEGKKPFKIDQDSGTKFRYEFSNWDDYNKYKGEKG